MAESKSLQYSIEDKFSFLDFLDKRRTEVKLEIQDAMCALHAALKARERRLLSHVDLVAGSMATTVTRELCLLHEVKGRKGDAPEVMGVSKTSETGPSEDLSFFGDIKEMEDALLNFGRIGSGKNAGGNTSRDLKDARLQCKSSESKELDACHQKSREKSEDERCSYAFDFEKCTFVETFGRDASTSSEEPNAAAKETIRQNPPESDVKSQVFLPSFHFDFSQNKFIPSSRESKVEKSNRPATDVRNDSSAGKSHRPGSFFFDFSTCEFVSEAEGRQKRACNEPRPFAGRRSKDSPGAEASLYDSVHGVLEAKLNEATKDKEVVSLTKSFVSKVENKINSTKSIGRSAGDPGFAGWLGSFRFDFKANRFLRVTQDPAGSEDSSDGGELFQALWQVVDLEIRKELEVTRFHQHDGFFDSAIRSFVEEVRKRIDVIADAKVESRENQGQHDNPRRPANPVDCAKNDGTATLDSCRILYQLPAAVCREETVVPGNVKETGNDAAMIEKKKPRAVPAITPEEAEEENPPEYDPLSDFVVLSADEEGAGKDPSEPESSPCVRDINWLREHWKVY